MGYNDSHRVTEIRTAMMHWCIRRRRANGCIALAEHDLLLAILLLLDCCST